MKRIFSKLLLSILQWSVWPSKRVRPLMAKLAGVDVDLEWSHIGENVIFDSMHPEKIHIAKCTAITMGCKILTHYLDAKKKDISHYTIGDVYIGERVFLGANTVICAPVSIGNDSIVGAGSVVLKDIPPCEVWGGVPARFLRKREVYFKSDVDSLK